MKSCVTLRFYMQEGQWIQDKPKKPRAAFLQRYMNHPLKHQNFIIYYKKISVIVTTVDIDTESFVSQCLRREQNFCCMVVITSLIQMRHTRKTYSLRNSFLQLIANYCRTDKSRFTVLMQLFQILFFVVDFIIFFLAYRA